MWWRFKSHDQTEDIHRILCFILKKKAAYQVIDLALGSLFM